MSWTFEQGTCRWNKCFFVPHVVYQNDSPTNALQCCRSYSPAWVLIWDFYTKNYIYCVHKYHNMATVHHSSANAHVQCPSYLGTIVPIVQPAIVYQPDKKSYFCFREYISSSSENRCCTRNEWEFFHVPPVNTIALLRNVFPDFYQLQ